MAGVEDSDWLPTPLTVEEALRAAADGRDELDLYQKDLPEVPPEVQGIKHLRAIHLYNSNVAALPEWLADLPALTLLDVSSNELTEVPFALLSRPGLEIRMHENPLDLGRMFRTLIEHYNAAQFEEVAAAFFPDVTLHLPGVRPANGTGPDGVAKMLGNAYPRYGMVQVIEANETRAVLKPTRAPQIELELSWRYGRLRRIDGGRCPKPAA